MADMVSSDRLLAFAAMSFLLIVVPGPSVLFVVGRALAQGRRAALMTVAGNTVGAYALVLGVALGIGTIVERSVLVFTLLKLAGAAYLITYVLATGYVNSGYLRRSAPLAVFVIGVLVAFAVCIVVAVAAHAWASGSSHTGTTASASPAA